MKTDHIKALYRSNFSAFLKFAFRELHSNQPLVDTWHIDLLADALERVVKGEITRLIINLPPRTLKSFAASIALPVWMLGRDPHLKIMSIAGSKELGGDFERATLNLMKSERCRALFPHLTPKVDKNTLILPHGGQRVAAVVGGALVGRGADLIIVDDPISPARVYDEARRRAVSTWFDAEVIQRLNDKTKGRVVVVMQRLHHEDLCGHLLDAEQPWVRLHLPAIAAADETWRLSSGRVLTRCKGEPLAPTIDDIATLYARMLDIGAYNFGAQYQQKPFVRMNDDGVRGGCFALPDDEDGLPQFAMMRVKETEIMAHEVFGVGDRHPATPRRRPSIEEWERIAVKVQDNQQRLLEDRNAEPGPLENEGLAAYRSMPGYRQDDPDEA